MLLPIAAVVVAVLAAIAIKPKKKPDPQPQSQQMQYAAPVAVAQPVQVQQPQLTFRQQQKNEELQEIASILGDKSDEIWRAELQAKYGPMLAGGDDA